MTCSSIRFVRYSLAITMVSVFTSMAIPTTSLDAQTVFSKGSKKFEANQYDFPDWCNAKLAYIISTNSAYANVVKDTLKFNSKELLEPLPDSAIQFGSACSKNWGIPVVTALDTLYVPWVQMLMSSGRNKDAEALTAARIVSVLKLPTETEMVFQLLRDMSMIVALAPINFDLLHQFAESLNSLKGAESTVGRMRIFANMMSLSLVSDDTAKVRHYATQIISIAENLSDDDKQAVSWNRSGGVGIYRDALNTISRYELIDSLRRSSGAYLSLLKSNASRASGNENARAGVLLGNVAPPLQSDYSFSSNSNEEPKSGEIHDLTGQLSMVVFLEHNCSQEVRLPRWRQWDGGGQCYDVYAVLRRIGDEFPNLKVYTVTQTRGFFGWQKPPAPQEEAKLLNTWWRNYQRLPGTLVVEKTDHWFIPGYDKRRIDLQTKNVENYSFDGAWQVRLKTAFLIDKSGSIIHAAELVRRTEKSWVELISAMSEQK